MDRPEFKCKIVSSLEKIFCPEELDAPALERIAGVRGETVNFQIVYKCDLVRVFITGCDIEAPEGVEFKVFNERLVPCRLPAINEDPLKITSAPGMFPSPLTEIDPTLSSIRGKWNALWASVVPGQTAAAGQYTLKIRLRWKPYVPCSLQTPAPEYAEDLELPLVVHDAELAPAKLICTQWFHADCLATYYHVEPWSERHWQIMESYMRDMTRHNINMLYTPLWSAPLDTAIGGERPTAQLLIIRKTADGKYEFDFSRLRRWFKLGLDCGFKYFEFAHAFTQWGAKATPKVVAEVDGVEKRIFGWDVPADSPEYERFLSSLMPELIKLLKELGIDRICRFHVSDEPNEEQLDAYMRAAKLLDKLTPGFVKMDALSHVEYFRAGATKCPIPKTNNLAEFMAEDIPERWVYYCGNWGDGVPNRMFGIPSYRNRALGVLLYALGIDGFLHWGYNFYYTQLSRRTDIDPWWITDAGGGFVGGDSYLVYPGADGKPVTSLQYEVFNEGLQDVRLLQTLERRIGREEVMKIVNEGLERPLAMTDYPHSARWLLDLHERVLARF